MADISTELTAIQTAVYGEEVRGSIHDAIEKINDEMEDAIDNQLLTIDDTLTVSGEAADAKIVGDEIAGLHRDITNATSVYSINGITFFFRRCGYFVNVITAGRTTEAMPVEQYTGGSVRVASIYRPVEDTILNLQATGSVAIQFYLSADREGVPGGELKIGWPGAQIPAGTSVRMNATYVSAAIANDTSSIFARMYTINGIEFIFRRIGRLVNVVTRSVTASQMTTSYMSSGVQVDTNFIPVSNTPIILYEQATVLASMQFNLSGTGELKFGLPSQTIAANTSIRMNITYVAAGGDAIDSANTYTLNGLACTFWKIGDLINVYAYGETAEQMTSGAYASSTVTLPIVYWPSRTMPVYLQATSAGDVQVNLSADGIVKIGQTSVTMPAGTTIRLSFTYVSADWSQQSSFKSFKITDPNHDGNLVVLGVH